MSPTDEEDIRTRRDTPVNIKQRDGQDVRGNRPKRERITRTEEREIKRCARV